MVSNQHAGRMARRNSVRGLYAGRRPSSQPDRSPVRSTDLPRIEHAQRAVMFWRCAVRQPAPGAWISGRRRDRARRDVHAGPAGAHARCRGDKTGAHCGVVYEFLHDRRVVVVPLRQDRDAVGLAQRFCSCRVPQYRRRRHRVGCTTAGGSRDCQGAAPGPRHQTGSRQSRCAHADLWLCRGDLGLGRTAAVDRRLSRVLCGRSGRCSRASVDHAR